MGLSVPTGPRGGTHRARESNIPTPRYQRHRVTHTGSYLRTTVRFLSQLYFRQLRVSCVLMWEVQRHTGPICRDVLVPTPYSVQRLSTYRTLRLKETSIKQTTPTYEQLIRCHTTLEKQSWAVYQVKILIHFIAHHFAYMGRMLKRSSCQCLVAPLSMTFLMKIA